MEYMDIISLVAFCATLVCAFLFKINTGLLSIAVAFILALVSNIPEADLFKAFGSKLFLILFGVMLLFSIAQENKTLELLARKTLRLCKGRVRLLPVVIFFISAIISAIGPGLISATALFAVLIVSLAKELRIPAIRLVPFGLMGSFAGGLSPVTPTGIVAINESGKYGIEGVIMPTALGMALTCVLYAAVLFFVLKWHKKSTVAAMQEAMPNTSEPFTFKQILTLLGILLTAVISVFGYNVGLVSILVSVILLLCKAADEGAAIKRVPWGTLLMVTGVGILISVVTALGGIALLETGLRKLCTDTTAAPVMTTLSGVMSWFSSASGVVMPTLIQGVPNVVADLPSVSPQCLVACISIGANMAAISPLSTCGGLMLGAYSSNEQVTLKDKNKMFVQLFALSACAVLFATLLAFTGLYGIKF